MAPPKSSADKSGAFRAAVTVLEVMEDPALFGRWFSLPMWQPWRVFLAALFGLPISEAHAALYTKCTGRTDPQRTPAREGWVIVGRRGGKSRIAALIAVYLAAFRKYRPHLAPGEVATVAVIAADRRQARVVMRYVAGFFDAIPMLRELVESRTRETLTLRNGVVIEVHTASFRSVRGYSLAAVIADEVAFWRADDSANPDKEIISGLRPGMATIPGALLLGISSPYARRGVLWDAYRRHFGKDGDPVLVWQASTETMNPSVDAQVIADSYAEDESAAASEYGAEFRKDLEAYVSREALEAVVTLGCHELAPAPTWRYRAFVDPSGGSQDSFTLAIAHRENGRATLDCVREWRPPFNPAQVVAEAAETLAAYRITSVVGDRYSGLWVPERFKEHRIKYEPSERTKSDIYGELLPLINSGRVALLDQPAAVTGARHDELLALQWAKDLDLDDGELTIQRSLSWAKAPGDQEPKARFYEPKTSAGYRKLPLPPELVLALKKWKLQCPKSALDLVFPTTEGGPMHRSNVLRFGLYPALARAGLRRVDMHSLRHSFASALIQRGAPINEVQKYMGHAKASTTLRVYTHFFAKIDTGALAGLAKALFSDGESADRKAHGA